MIDFDFKPESYFTGIEPSVLLVKLTYPESQWGEEIHVYVNVIDGECWFEAVDFYGNDIVLNPEKSKHILTLQELILMLESMETKDNAQGNISLTLSGIPEAESQLYPELKKYFADKRKSFGLD